MEGLRLLGEFGDTQPFVYCICKPVFKSVLEVTIRPFGAPCNLLEVCRILGYCLASLTELDKLLFCLGDVVPCLESSIEGFDKGGPCSGKGEGVVGILVVPFNGLEVGDGPQSSISL